MKNERQRSAIEKDEGRYVRGAIFYDPIQADKAFNSVSGIVDRNPGAQVHLVPPGNKNMSTVIVIGDDESYWRFDNDIMSALKDKNGREINVHELVVDGLLRKRIGEEIEESLKQKLASNN
ncbi:MAG TPA: hypothetical protein VG917_04510 [Patescibacteria group bacterium]|nr:hypothetical protein [Patescibacteria group bacterium]